VASALSNGEEIQPTQDLSIVAQDDENLSMLEQKSDD
jgi:hypothetical protein